METFNYEDLELTIPSEDDPIVGKTRRARIVQNVIIGLLILAGIGIAWLLAYGPGR